MKKIISMLLLSMGSMLQGMEQKEIAPLTSDKETTSQSASEHPLSIADFWSNFTPYLLYNEGPQVTTQTIKASSCVDKATFSVFKNTRLKDVIINFFERYALNKLFKKEEVLDNLFPVLFANAQQMKTLYADESAAIEAFVETLKSCAQSKDWSPALAQLEVIRKEPRLVSQLNKAYWDVNPLVRTTVLSHALLLNAPKELIKSLINCGAPLTNLSPKVLPPLLILAMKTRGAEIIAPTEILGKTVGEIVSNEVVDRTYVKELITLLCASGAQIEDAFCNSFTSDPFLKKLSALEWAILTYDKELLDHLLSQQKKILLLNPCLLAVQKIITAPLKSSVTAIQRLEGEECFKLLLQDSKNNVSKLFGYCADIIAAIHSPSNLEAGLVASLIENIIRLFSLLIDSELDINHLINKRTLLDRAQDEGWHKDIIDFLIKKGACKSSCELTQKEIKALTFQKAFQDKIIKHITGQPIEQEEIRDFLKDTLEIMKNGYMDFDDDASFNYICALALDLGASLEETLEFLTWSESHNLFSSELPSYGNISSVFHKIVSWLNDFKRARPENVFNKVIKRESLRSLVVKLAEKGVKDKPNSEGKTAAQKAYELGLEEIAHVIADAVTVNKGRICKIQ